MQYASSPFTDVHSGQVSTSFGPWSDAPLPLPDPRDLLGPSVPRPTAAEWHTSDGSMPSPSWLTLQYPSSPDSPSTSATSPASSSRASSPSTSSPGSPRPKKKSPSRRNKDPSHVPRPRNAFILFRSEKCEHFRQSNVETDHRIISRIIGDWWKNVSPEEKKYYMDKAAQEKEEHARLYPDYRYSPKARLVPPKRRKVKRNGETDRQRCRLIADLLQKGDSNKLKETVDEFDRKTQQEKSHHAAHEAGDVYTTAVFDSSSWVPPSTPPLSSPSAASTCSETPFRSPLLPPSTPPSAPTSNTVAIQEQSLDPLTPLQLGPGVEDSCNGRTIQPTHLPTPEAVDNTAYSQPASFPLPPAVGFGALHSQQQGVLGMSNLYPPPRVPQFEVATPAHNFHFQDQALFSVDPSFHEPSYALDAGAQIPDANLAPYQGDFQLPPQSMPQQQDHSHLPFGIDPLAYSSGYAGGFGMHAPYGATQEGMYPMWPSGQASGLEGSVQAEPVHLGGYMAPY
ncbi:hypothetical protein L227DRAFT_654830 [Lentinus tigrinus ALCF2SS1-6]|uniref:HMG box domain-containing protein n=1 Tax=Lentinus tigrinus ALCF2SS1-6 TaxID=1328759 RepID=A0A5C2S4F5_9APHY|nr:hypothetical protein L227DRAFT_654830 [Lentinus tigrinus ALCF2SS1-6]